MTQEQPRTLQKIGQYRLLRRLAIGGMSSVFQAYDEKTNQTIALKVLAEQLQNQPEFVRRFKLEATLIKLVQHEHIVRSYNSGLDADSGKRFIAMEYISGPSAAALLQKAIAIPWPIVARISLDIANALSFLHTIHFVHRDVKPDNILIDRVGVSKLIDFGLVKNIDTDQGLSAANHGVGTPYYMSQEQTRNSSIVDGRSDLFSLAATMYHLATGAVPFPGESQEEVDRNKKTGNVVSMRSIRPEITKEFNDFVMKSLSADIQGRYQSANEFIRALAGFACEKSEVAEYLTQFADDGEAVQAFELNPTRTDLGNK